MAGAFDAIVQLLLFACFALYVALGLGFVIMGGIYLNEVGEAADTALVLLIVGLMMLVIGGVAIFGNMKKGMLGALILFIVEIINMVLFLVLYIFIIAAVMILLGIDDPIRKGTTDTWELQRPELEAQGYCKTTGLNCDRQEQLLAAMPTDCQLTPVEVSAATMNCTIYAEYRYDATNTYNGGSVDDLAWMNKYGSCGTYLTDVCRACDKECMEKAISTVKEYLVPAAVRNYAFAAPRAAV